MRKEDFKQLIMSELTKEDIYNTYQKNEIITLCLYQVFQSPSLKPLYNNFLFIDSYNEHEFGTLARYSKNGTYQFITSDLNILPTTGEFRELWRNKDRDLVNNLKNNLEKSDNFSQFFNTMEKIQSVNENIIKDIQNQIEKSSLINMMSFINDIDKGVVKNINANQSIYFNYPYSYFYENGNLSSMQHLMKIDQSERLNYLKDNVDLLNLISSMDNISIGPLNNIEKFLNNQNNKNSTFLEIVLNHDNLKDTIIASIQHLYFEKYKKEFINLAKIINLKPTYEDILNEYPIVTTLVDKIYEQYPYLNIEAVSSMKHYSFIENKQIGTDGFILEKDDNYELFRKNINNFGIPNKISDSINQEYNPLVQTMKYFGASPLNMLYSISGKLIKNNHNTIRLFEFQENNLDYIEDSLKKEVYHKFIEDCIKNNIVIKFNSSILTYNSPMFFEVLETFGDSVLILDKKAENFLLKEHIIEHLNLTYNELVKCQKEIDCLSSDISKESAIKQIEYKNSGLKNRLT